ncbi:MAG: efflux RND transporter permease subunit [Deltaproteobacteria bacterium]|nr:efflux RND transporter permease subunit [Deltaproteobacteria bacterium]
MKLADFSVDHPVPVAVAYIVLFVLSMLALTRLSLDLLPDTDYPVVAIMARYRGVAPEEMEKLVAEHLEAAAASVDGVRKVKTVSLQGECGIMVEFEWEADLNVGAQDVRNQIELALDSLPREVERPVVLKFDMDLLPVAYYGIYSTGGRDLRTLRKFIKDTVGKRMTALPGVASAAVQGGLEREILIEVDRDRLKSRNVTLEQVSDSLKRQNLDYPGGHMDVGRNEFIVRTKGKYASLADIENTIIRAKDGGAVYIKDVAAVKDSYQEVRSHSRTNGHDSVLLTVAKEPGANTVQVVDRITAEMEEVQKTLPPDIKVVHVYDTSRLIRGALEHLAYSSFWGFFFAAAIIYVFLLSVKTTLTMMFAMVFSVIATFIVIYFFGDTLNVMTLSGIALSIGHIVDNAIVVVENIIRRIEGGEPSFSAAKTGTSEVLLAISASTLASIIVFLPMALSPGATGILTRSLGITVVFSMLISLLVAVTLVPPLAAREFRGGERKKAEHHFFDRIRGWYVAAIEGVLNNRGKSILGAAGLFAAALVLMQFVGTEYIPKLDESDGTAVIKLEPGLSLKDADAFMRDMEKVVASQPEYVSMLSMVGRSEKSTIDMVFGIAPADVNEGEMYFELKPAAERTRGFREICDSISGGINLREGVVVYFMDTLDWFLGGGERPIELKIFGNDLEELQKLGAEAETIMRDVKGVTDLDNSLKPGKPELQIKIDREKASRLGITVEQIAATVDTAFLGEKSGKYREAGEEYNIRVKYSQADRNDPEKLGSVLIAAPDGSQHYLHEVADMVKGIGPSRINREEQRRVVVLSANVTGRDLGGTVDEIKHRLSALSLPEGYTIMCGGGYEDMQEMQAAMVLTVALVILLVYLVMTAQFESFLQPLAIFFSVPMALIGVAVILFLTNTTLSLMSFIGILILVGLAVNNAIILIDYINRLRKSGMEKREAIIRAGSIRLRPILMGSLTTILGLLPLSVLKGDGYEIFAPISITLLGGMLTSTFLTLLVVPAWYSLIDEWAAKIKKKR